MFFKKEKGEGRNGEEGTREGPPVAEKNKAGYTATEVACRWAGVIFEVTRPFG